MNAKDFAREDSKNTDRFFVIPGDAPLSLHDAYRRAIKRFRVNQSNAREDHAGICWQGDHGQTHYATWSDLPPAVRPWA